MTTTQLPDRLSDLLELALRDLEKAEADPGVNVNMDWWLWKEQGQCFACLAGCVMRYSLSLQPSFEMPSLVPSETEFGTHLLALNYLRSGELSEAYEEMFNAELPFGVPERTDATPYSDDPAAFKSDMARIVTLLREKGL